MKVIGKKKVEEGVFYNHNFGLKESGITLVALVVTIIILLILAGVAIRSVTGDNGTFRKAKEAVNTWREAEDNERDVLEYLTAELGNISQLESSTDNTGNLNEELEKIKKERDQLNFKYNTFRGKVIQAIVQKKVETTEENTDDEIVENIGKIRQETFSEKEFLYNSGYFQSEGNYHGDFVSRSYTLTEEDIKNYSGFMMVALAAGYNGISMGEVWSLEVPEDSITFALYTDSNDLGIGYTRVAFINKQQETSTLTATMRGRCVVHVYGLK